MLMETMKLEVPGGFNWLFNRFVEMAAVFMCTVIFNASTIVIENNFAAGATGIIFSIFLSVISFHLQNKALTKDLKWSNSVLWSVLFSNYTVILVIMEFMAKAAYRNNFGIPSLAMCILLAAVWATTGMSSRPSS